MEFRDRLRAVRDLRGLSQYRLAKESGVAQATIWRLEAGKQSGEYLSFGVVIKLAKTLQVPLDYLAGLLDELPG